MAIEARSVYTETGLDMRLVTRIRQAFRPNMEVHERLRKQARETLILTESIKGKREKIERELPEREFPMAGFLERERASNERRSTN